MPTYDYKSEDGEVLEREFTIATVPQTIEHQGKTYKKVIAFGGFNIR